MINSQHHPLRIMFYNAILLFCASILFQCCDVGRGCGSCIAQGDFSPITTFWLSAGNNIYSSNSGNVGIGTTNPLAPLHIYKSDGSAGLLIDNAGSQLRFVSDATDSRIGPITNQGLIFQTNAGDKMAITTVGNVGIGKTNPQKKLDVVGGGTFSDTLRVGDYTTFGVYLPGALSWVVSSSSSLKDSIRDYNITDVKKIYDLHPRVFKWKKSASTDSLKIDTQKEQLGYIADEVGIVVNDAQKKKISLTEIVALQHLAIIDLNNRLKTLGK